MQALRLEAPSGSESKRASVPLLHLPGHTPRYIYEKIGQQEAPLPRGYIYLLSKLKIWSISLLVFTLLPPLLHSLLPPLLPSLISSFSDCPNIPDLILISNLLILLSLSLSLSFAVANSPLPSPSISLARSRSRSLSTSTWIEDAL